MGEQTSHYAGMNSSGTGSV